MGKCAGGRAAHLQRCEASNLVCLLQDCHISRTHGIGRQRRRGRRAARSCCLLRCLLLLQHCQQCLACIAGLLLLLVLRLLQVPLPLRRRCLLHRWRLHARRKRRM